MSDKPLAKPFRSLDHLLDKITNSFDALFLGPRPSADDSGAEPASAKGKLTATSGLLAVAGFGLGGIVVLTIVIAHAVPLIAAGVATALIFSAAAINLGTGLAARRRQITAEGVERGLLASGAKPSRRELAQIKRLLAREKLSSRFAERTSTPPKNSDDTSATATANQPRP